jgi:hypothetical protein
MRSAPYPLPQLALVTSLACLLTQPGCSWLFTTPPPKDFDRHTYLECTTNRVPPVLDTIFTITNVASAIYVAGQENVQNKGSAVGLGLSVATLWMLSAVYGYSGTSACEEAQASYGGRGAYRPLPRPAPRLNPGVQQVAPGPPAPPPPAPAPTPAAAAPEGAEGAPPVAPTRPAAAPTGTQQVDDDDPDAVRRPRPQPSIGSQPPL